MADQPKPSPKVFISYSWTSDDHTQWVGDLAERLMNDGVDVILDQWSLEDGHDVHVFMEKMVTDPTIKRVIVISDAVYAAKADDRKGGVGTETQIISKEIYDSVDQTKFVPVVRERDKDGKACLPVYLRNRKYIDFSDPDNEAEAYDQLLRNIFERPRRPKPALGTPPSHLFDDESTVFSSAQKAKRFRDFLASGKGNPSSAFQDFTDAFLADFGELRMTYSHTAADTWCDQISENIERATVLRDVFIDTVYAGAAHWTSEQFMPALFSFLERILPFSERPDGPGGHFRCSEDNYKLLCYELFLYSFSSFIKIKKYAEARQLIVYQYVAPRTFGGCDLHGNNFSRFNSYADSLEKTCAERDGRRRLSVMADLIHDRATNKQLRFSDVLQADVLLWIASNGSGWYPRCMVYGSSAGKLELFVRAESVAGFAPLGQILDLQEPKQLLEHLSSPSVQRTLGSEMFFHAHGAEECLNLDELNRRWGNRDAE